MREFCIASIVMRCGKIQQQQFYSPKFYPAIIAASVVPILFLSGCANGATPAGLSPTTNLQSAYQRSSTLTQQLISQGSSLRIAAPAPPLNPNSSREMRNISKVPSGLIRASHVPAPQPLDPPSVNGAPFQSSSRRRMNTVVYTHGAQGPRMPTTSFGNAVAYYGNMTVYNWTIAAGKTIYAPTFSGLNRIPYELTVVYNSQSSYIGVWDWVKGTGFFNPMTISDPTFQKYYVANLGDGLPEITVETTWNGTNSRYTAYIYNYYTRAWNTWYNASGGLPAVTQDGHDIFEYYLPLGSNCLVIPKIASSGISVYDQTVGKWIQAGPANSYDNRDSTDTCFSGGYNPWVENMITANNHWQMTGGLGS
jgi:hypothetical protein